MYQILHQSPLIQFGNPTKIMHVLDDPDPKKRKENKEIEIRTENIKIAKRKLERIL
jgi:hypothetical protein